MSRKIIEYTDPRRLKSVILNCMSLADVVLVGNHETYPEVHEGILTDVLPNVNFNQIEVPGDGEPCIWALGNVDGDRLGEILAAYEDWYLDEFPNLTEVLGQGEIDTDGHYSLSMFYDCENRIYFVCVEGDSPCEDD
jgi:hypothetical protein